MKETRFIERNKETWKEFDDHLKARRKDPDKLSELFIKLTDDLSYARTFYPRRSVRVFLNNQAQRVFVNLYRNKRLSFGKLLQFWKEDIPNIVWHSRREMLLSFLMVVLFIIIGVFSSIHDSDFARVILGDSYINMTEENIAEGDPMAVYKGDSEILSSLRITLNNLRVDLLAFVMGVFFSIGTVWILLRNGIMIGAFQYFFVEKGLFWPSFLTIFQHGTLEVSAMVISGAAGLALGRGLLFPGTFTRLQAFQQGAIKALKLFLSVVPITIMAGFIEGFITRHTDVPDGVRILVITLSLAFIIFYYILLPLKKRGKAPVPPELRASGIAPVPAYLVRSTGEIFTAVFRILRRFWAATLLQGTLISGLLTVALLVEGTIYSDMELLQIEHLFQFENVFYGIFLTAGNIMQTISFNLFPQAAVLVGLAFTFTSIFTFRQSLVALARDEQELAPVAGSWNFFRVNFGKVLVVTALFMGLGFLPGMAGRLLFFFLMPVYLLWSTSNVIGKTNIYNGLIRTFTYTAHRIGRLYGVYIIFFLLAMILITVIASPLTFLYMDIVKDILPGHLVRGGTFFHAGYFFLLFFLLNTILVLLVTGHVFVYYSFREISAAVSLRRRIQKFRRSN